MSSDRHPGGGPRRAARLDRGAGRRAAHLRRPPGVLRPGQVDDLADARRPRARRAAGARPTTAATSRAACSGCTPRGTTRGEELVRLARPMLERVGEETHETVNLSVARGDQVVQVAQVDSQFLLGTRDWTEVDVPAHCSALGKVFYAWDVLSTSPTAGSSGSPTRPSPTATRCARDARRARKRGWAVTVDELEVGLTGVAVPVRGTRGDVVAALGVSGPTPRLEGRLDELGRLLTTPRRGADRAAARRPRHHPSPRRA